jgi:hypothetical protein
MQREASTATTVTVESEFRLPSLMFRMQREASTVTTVTVEFRIQAPFADIQNAARGPHRRPGDR